MDYAVTLSADWRFSRTQQICQYPQADSEVVRKDDRGWIPQDDRKMKKIEMATVAFRHASRVYLQISQVEDFDFQKLSSSARRWSRWIEGFGAEGWHFVDY